MAGPGPRHGPLCGRRHRHPRADGGGGGGRIPAGARWRVVGLVLHRAGDGACSGGLELVPTPPRSPKREASPREEVLQASFQHNPAHQGPPAHLWTPPPYVDLVSNDDDDTDDK
ncbi:hypothetical protein D1007_59064 [Hordeum vulgare]|nr:hypothetical protein D1007_59064 [Hordeum vulgare]